MNNAEIENKIKIIIDEILSSDRKELEKSKTKDNISLKSKDDLNKDKMIPLEASGRHLHLSQQDIEELFGEAYQLTAIKELSQPGQFLAEEKLKLIGPKGVIDSVSILGPARSSSQLELSKTDAINLGIDAPLRFSGDISGSASVFLASQMNMIKLNEGVIIAKRHIHMTPEDADNLDVEDGEIVAVEALTERPIIFKDVLIRINKDYKLNMHIDYDEANACLYRNGDRARIIKQ